MMQIFLKLNLWAAANLSPEVFEMQLADGSRLGDNVDVIKGFAKIAKHDVRR